MTASNPKIPFNSFNSTFNVLWPDHHLYYIAWQQDNVGEGQKLEDICIIVGGATSGCNFDSTIGMKKLGKSLKCN